MIHLACALFVRDHKLLLAKRAPHKRAYPGCWDLIGGHIEPGETVEQALIREAAEEAGVIPVRFESIGRLEIPTNVATYHLFRVTAWTGGAPRLLGDEHTEIGWFTIDQACAVPGLALQQYRAIFRDPQLDGPTRHLHQA